MHTLSSVVLGLDPRIHPHRTALLCGMDPRVKPEDDEGEVELDGGEVELDDGEVALMKTELCRLSAGAKRRPDYPNRLKLCPAP
jgi:hypothetical protein